MQKLKNIYYLKEQTHTKTGFENKTLSQLIKQSASKVTAETADVKKSKLQN